MRFTDCLQTTLLGETLLSIHVVPGAKQSGLIEYDRWTKSLRIAVKARAEGGKANSALIYVMSEILSIPKQDIEIISASDLSIASVIPPVSCKTTPLCLSPSNLLIKPKNTITLIYLMTNKIRTAGQIG